MERWDDSVWEFSTGIRRGMEYVGFVLGTGYYWIHRGQSKVERQKLLGKKIPGIEMIKVITNQIMEYLVLI